jgi:hypothetical protein
MGPRIRLGVDANGGSSGQPPDSALVAIVVAAVAIVIPVMVMLAAAVIALPVSMVEAFPIVTRSYPHGATISRTCPVAVMPTITMAHHEPVAWYPDEPGAGTRRRDTHDTRRRWRSDADSNGNIGGEKTGAYQQQRDQ